MEIRYHKEFLKNYKKRIATKPKLRTQFNKRLQLLIENFNNPILKDHKLTGKLSSYRAFSVTGNIRVIYEIVSGEVWFYDIGTHNQVY